MGEGKNRRGVAVVAEPEGSGVVAEIAETPLEKLIGTDVSVAGEVIRIGPLGLNQTLGLAHLVAQAALRMDATTRGQLAVAAGALGNKDEANIMAVLALLDEKTIGGLYGVFLNRPTEWAIKHFKLPEFLRVFDAVGEHNDPTELMALFRNVVTRWRPRSTT